MCDFLVSLPQEEWERMRATGQAFLRSEEAARYGAQEWVDTLTAHLVGDQRPGQ